MNTSKDNIAGGSIGVNKKRGKKTNNTIKVVIIIAVILAAVIFIMSRMGFVGGNNASGAAELTTYTVGTRTITEILTSSGTIEPCDQYTINALVSGEIIGDYFDEGDTVIEDQLLYEIDSDNLNSTVTRAKNSLKNANNSLNDALENMEKLNVESDVGGIVKKIHVEVGDEINAGTLIADVVDNETMCIDIPFMTVDCNNISIGDSAVVTFNTYEEVNGTVTEINPVTQVNTLGVSVKDVTISVKNSGSITTSTTAYARIGDAYCTNSATFYNNDEGQVFSKAAGEVSKIYYDEGDRINKGNVIIRLESEDLEDQIDRLRDTVTEAEESLEDANDAFDNYNIEAPITGKVISKSYKAGDTLSGGQAGSNTMAVIYDMSALKFTMNIDELDIDKLDEGQDVIITCDSREGEEYHGVITNISIQGSTSSGTTVYPVEVTIDNVEDIAKRTVSEDGTVNKVFKTGMTSTEKTYNLVSKEKVSEGIIYTYSDNIVITKLNDGTLYDSDKLLKPYLDDSYTQGSSFYGFASDYSTLTLEIQNDKKMLRPGMNIDAEIIVENRENIIAIPLAAVGRGNVVKVKKNEDEKVQSEQLSSNDMPKKDLGEKSDIKDKNIETNTSGITENKSDGFGIRNGYGTAGPDTEFVEVRVTVGISDDDFVEITSGLNIGDVVIVDSSNLASDSQYMQFGMIGGMNGMGGMNGGPMMNGSGRMPNAGGMSGGPMGR